jgi:hypothetical protein
MSPSLMGEGPGCDGCIVAIEPRYFSISLVAVGAAGF